MSRNKKKLLRPALEITQESKDKGLQVLDHIVDALAYHSSCPIRRGLVLIDIYTHPMTSQSDIRGRMEIGKSALNRDVDWMFNYGAIRRYEGKQDARKVTLEVSDYSREHLDAASALFDNGVESLVEFLVGMQNVFNDEKSTLRDAKILATIYSKGQASRQEVLESLYNGSKSTENRAIMKLIEEGVIENDESE